MRIPCPRCQSFVVPGAQSCAWCGASLLQEATPGSADPVCAVHPELRSLHACGRCGSFACARCLRKGARDEPLCAACHDRVPADALPWDRRDELGTPRAYWQTCVAVMLRPTATFERARPVGSVGSSLGFAALSNLAASFTTALVYLAILLAIPSAMTEGDNVSAHGLRLVGLGVFGAMMVMAPVMGMLVALINAALDHVVFRMDGTGQPFEVTLRANALSMSPYLMGLIPFCGIYGAPLWALGLRIFAYRSMHRTTWGTAVLGALAVPLLSCGLLFAGYAVVAVVGAATGFGK
ncbi:YIP1 family protein [Myxococcus sp. AM010]|uniref:YIP1 family protein n=1 Tax=Myxococcus sp. AM010 TaxID=2745138 RepID=UPI001596368B|nr:YIP1 family protein [Myxococcus sp. AM010]NVJ19328.1 YIP1 family protein [Myxococcus sp. AM010]